MTYVNVNNKILSLSLCAWGMRIASIAEKTITAIAFFSAIAAIFVYTRMTSESVSGHFIFISFTITTLTITISRRNMAEILPIRHKTLSNQSINQLIN